MFSLRKKRMIKNIPVNDAFKKCKETSWKYKILRQESLDSSEDFSGLTPLREKVTLAIEEKTDFQTLLAICMEISAADIYLAVARSEKRGNPTQHLHLQNPWYFQFPTHSKPCQFQLMLINAFSRNQFKD